MGGRGEGRGRGSVGGEVGEGEWMTAWRHFKRDEEMTRSRNVPIAQSTTDD